jgi:class 3 adenylate cyclase
MDVGDWLRKLGLEQYEVAFRENEISEKILPNLTAEDLKDLGVGMVGHRRMLLDAIAALRAPASASAPLSDASPATDEAARDTAERRQLTVMFCDLAGSTALSARLDPEDMRDVIRAYQDACSGAIARYDGFVAKFMGDGILAYFGYPRAHEDDAERAVRSGLEISTALAKLGTLAEDQLKVRIGIATGLVIVGDLIGQGSAQEQSVVGDTPNLAARLQSVAEPGTIVVSEQVRRLAGGSFDYEDLGELTLKGIAKPTHGYRIIGVSETASRFEAATQRGLTPLVGRDHEIGLLLERWKLAQDGEGQVVLVSGEPGMGKSRILSALRGRLEELGTQSLRFQCSPYYVNSAFWPIIDNFERTLKFAPDEQQQSKLDKLEAMIVNDYGRPLGDVRFIASLLSIPCEQRYGALALTPRKHRDETLRSLAEITAAVARKQASVMLFEDAHWADPTTLQVLDLLIDGIGTIPLLIVLTHRPEFQPKWTRLGNVSALNLSRLTPAESSAMISEVTGGKVLPPGLVEQIVTKTDGVPLFVEELTKSILEVGGLRAVGDRYEYVESGQSITIPATLRDSLMARLDRFAPVKEIAQIGAAIGRQFSYELVQAVSPKAKNELDIALQQLTDSGLAFRRGTVPEATYTFKHALVRDAAYDSLLKSRRPGLHGKIARVIEDRFPQVAQTEPEVLAHHYTQAGLLERGAEYWFQAGRAAIARMALPETIAHLEAGLNVLCSLPASVKRDQLELEIRVLLITAWEAYAGWSAPQLIDVLKSTLPLARRAGQPKALASVLTRLRVSSLTQGRVADSLTWAEELLRTCEQSDDEELLLIGHMGAMVTRYWLGDLVVAAKHGQTIAERYVAERHSHLVQTMNHDPKSTLGMYAANWVWMLGYPDRAAVIAEECFSHARLIGHPFNYSFALIVGSYAFYFRGEYEKYFTCLNTAQALAQEVSPFLKKFISGHICLAQRGGSSEQIERMRTSVEFFDSAGAGSHQPYRRSQLGEAFALAGDVDNALANINLALEQIARPGWEERLAYAEILRLKGWMLSLKDDHKGAERNYLASLDFARRQQARSWELRTSMSLARLWRDQGKRDEARELLAPIYGWFTEGFDTRDLKEAKALLDELAQ